MSELTQELLRRAAARINELEHPPATELGKQIRSLMPAFYGIGPGCDAVIENLAMWADAIDRLTAANAEVRESAIVVCNALEEYTELPDCDGSGPAMKAVAFIRGLPKPPKRSRV